MTTKSNGASILYLLDTNILSDLIRNPGGRLRDKIAQVGEDAICTSIIVASELRFGARKRGSRKLTGQVNAVLSALEILALDAPADDHYAQLRCQLERTGQPIGANDMLIAAHALSMGLTLVSANTREFSHVPRLKLENWLPGQPPRRP